MSSEIVIKSATVVEDKEMENVQLHRAESMINEKLEIVNEINKEKPPYEINDTVYNYIGSKARSFGYGLIEFSVEIIMIMYMFSYMMRSVTSTTMIMEKVCVVHLKYAQEVCHNLKDYPDNKTEVEKLANNYHLGYSFIQMLPAALLALFIGSWSDKYSRKIPIIIALVGTIIDGLGSSICAHFLESRVEYYFIPAVFTGFTGGLIGCMMVLYSYASDVTTPGTRTMKYAVVEVAFGVSIPVGSLAGGWLYKYAGYVPVFLTSTCGYTLGLFWVIFFLKETRGLDNKDTWIQKFRNFWSLDSAVSSFKATLKKRPNRGRMQLWLLILGISIAVFSFASLAGIQFFYVHHLYNWENTTFSTINAVYQVIGLCLMLVIVPLCKKYNLGDPVLGIVGSISLMVKNIVLGFAFQPWIYHLASLLGLFTTLASLAGRARVSKIISKDDFGKVFAFLTTTESLLPILATAIVSQIFNATIHTFPGLILVIMGVSIVIPLSVFIWMARLPSYEETSYEEMDDGSPEDNELTKTEVLPQEKY